MGVLTFTALGEPASLPAGTDFTYPVGLLADGRELWGYGQDLGSGVGYRLGGLLYDRAAGTYTLVPMLPGRDDLSHFRIGRGGQVVFAVARTANRYPATGPLQGYSLEYDTRAVRWTPAGGTEALFTDDTSFIQAVSQDGSVAAAALTTGYDAEWNCDLVSLYTVTATGAPTLVASNLRAEGGVHTCQWLNNAGTILGGAEYDTTALASVPRVWGSAAPVAPTWPANFSQGDIVAGAEDGSVLAGYGAVDSWAEDYALIHRGAAHTIYDPVGIDSTPYCYALSADGSVGVWKNTTWGASFPSPEHQRCYLRSSEVGGPELYEFGYYLSLAQYNEDLTWLLFDQDDGSGTNHSMLIVTIDPFWAGALNCVEAG
jgi:hypothetical protein